VSRLIAYFGNDPDNMVCALFSARNALYARSTRRIEGWALGFVQVGDVLLQKRPRADATEVDFYALARDLKADALVGRVGLGHDGNTAAEDADPFRFRSWLFASSGVVPSFDRFRDRLLESIPDFLRRNIRGHSPSEHLFHLFLAYLHDAGILESPSPAPTQVKAAIQSMLAFVSRLLDTSGNGGDRQGRGLELALVATNGRCLVGTVRSHPMQFLRIDGISDCTVCQGRASMNGDGRRISHEALRAVIIECDPSTQGRPGWRAVPDRAALVIGPDRIPELAPLTD
jgi:glutamine amidotransferase